MAITNQNRIIRKMIVAFGNMFSNITLVRMNENGTEQERFLVPVTYAPKEQYVQRLESDPDLDKKVQMTLPRMSYEMMGMRYDASRKQNTNVKNFSKTGSLNSYYNPVPYDFDFSLSIYTRNHEDVHSIVECMLPFFTPDYTLSVNLLPESGVTKEIPIVLNRTDREVTYEGNRDSDLRMIIWTLDFTLKGYIYGTPSDASNTIITKAITNIFDYDTGYKLIDIVSTPLQSIDIDIHLENGSSLVTEHTGIQIETDAVDISANIHFANTLEPFIARTTINEHHK